MSSGRPSPMQTPMRTPSVGRTPSTGRSTGRRAASTGGRPGQPRKVVIQPYVAAEERMHPRDCQHGYETRFMSTSTQRMQSNVMDCVDQCRETNAAKEAFFTQHRVPNLTWMDLHGLTQDRSMKQKQPAYFADVGGPQRIGVMPRAHRPAADTTMLMPQMSICSKAGKFFGT
eukprot:TRINITY_DN23689_c0_g3_i1.p1 TRINITY_DN23689_c0_g3~~TRINITY_DN23689_c0_g3_i1.p1  ORF type:complete len:172 (-),score=20.60 TRINITY_DN23689_c0_g3_i1:226-741(-)